AQHISDCGWGTFVNFLDYKLEREDKRLVEIDRWFPSSHICPDCLTQQPKMELSIRKWNCINSECNARHDRDEAASKNIRAEGIRIIKAEGTPASEARRECKTRSGSQDQGSAAPSEARNYHLVPLEQVVVVH
ncbi:MAG: transposase, partial [Cyanobacteriota bacterium]|nr:transposase [Cyanobacteriota bacterium]